MRAGPFACGGHRTRSGSWAQTAACEAVASWLNGEAGLPRCAWRFARQPSCLDAGRTNRPGWRKWPHCRRGAGWHRCKVPRALIGSRCERRARRAMPFAAAPIAERSTSDTCKPASRRNAQVCVDTHNAKDSVHRRCSIVQIVTRSRANGLGSPTRAKRSTKVARVLRDGLYHRS